MKTFLKWGGFIFLFLIICVMIIMKVGSRDLPPQRFPSLESKWEKMPEAENAFPLFVKAYEVSTLEKHRELIQQRSIHPIPADDFARIMDENTEMIQLLEQGIGKNFYQSPELTGFDDLVPEVSEWLLMSNFLAAASENYVEQGRFDDALDCISLVLKFGGKVQSNPESLIHYLVSLAQLDLGLTQGKNLLKDPRIPIKDLNRLAIELSEISSLHQGTVIAFQKEFRFSNWIVRGIDDGTIRLEDLEMLNGDNQFGPLGNVRAPAYFFHPNRTRGILAAYFLQSIENASLSYSEMKFMDVDALYRNEGIFPIYFKPNAIGKLVIAISLPGLDRVLEKVRKTEGRIAAVQLIAALKRYENAHGVFPVSLDLLVPDYLQSVPLDPFDGHRFRYDPVQKVIYSVGKNGVDDAGSQVLIDGRETDSEDRKRWKAKDAVFHLER